MAPRHRLPLVSPSALPAPKYGRQQQHSRRVRKRSFWESESDQYWEKCRHKKRSTRRKAVGLVVVVVVVVVVVLMSLSWSFATGLRGRTEEPALPREDLATSAFFPEETASSTGNGGISDGLRLQTLACVGSGKKHDLESKTCANLCAKARTTAPRPLAHRSCLAGCRAGVAIAWDAACVGGRHRDCVRESTERCDFHCASYRNQFPKPTIFNQCLRSCLDVVDTTCLKSKEVYVSVPFHGRETGGPTR
ncbi:unnamed protein product [Hapterophycus canaliculatus]